MIVNVKASCGKPKDECSTFGQIWAPRTPPCFIRLVPFRMSRSSLLLIWRLDELVSLEMHTWVWTALIHLFGYFQGIHRHTGYFNIYSRVID